MNIVSYHDHANLTTFPTRIQATDTCEIDEAPIEELYGNPDKHNLFKFSWCPVTLPPLPWGNPKIYFVILALRIP
jgi:hypothetical protein